MARVLVFIWSLRRLTKGHALVPRSSFDLASGLVEDAACPQGSRYNMTLPVGSCHVSFVGYLVLV